MRHAILSSFVAALLTSAATAQLTDVAPFAGRWVEQFDASLPGGRCIQNHATLTASPGGQMMITYGWLVYVGYTVYPRGLSNSFLGTVVGHAILTLDNPVQRFGAYYAAVGYVSGGYAMLYDEHNNLIAQKPLAAPRGGPWTWDGWDSGPLGPKIKRVELFANDPYNGGALLCVEDVQIDTWLATTTRRTTGCGTLGITQGGLAVPGDTLTFGMTGASGFSGFVLGSATSAPIGPCPGCTLGVNGITVTGTSYLLDIPNSPALLDATLSAQAFSLGSGPCLSIAQLSDTLDVRIGEAP